MIDASVAVKWLVADSKNEPNTDKASELLRAIKENRIDLVQPPHWLAEVVAVITRLRPEIASEAIDLLDALELAVVSDAEVFKHASKIARRLNRHVFDTLYHAVALERDAVLITADERYLRKARALGHIAVLEDWAPPAAAAS